MIIKNNDLDESTFTVNLAGVVEDKVKFPTISNNSNRQNESSITGIPDQVKVSAYPNPSSTGWQVTIDNPGNYSYRLINEKGDIITTGIVSTNTFKIPADQLPAGGYFLYINDKKITQVIKLVKQ